jgi:hypothetical protein
VTRFVAAVFHEARVTERRVVARQGLARVLEPRDAARCVCSAVCVTEASGGICISHSTSVMHCPTPPIQVQARRSLYIEHIQATRERWMRVSVWCMSVISG